MTGNLNVGIVFVFLLAAKVNGELCESASEGQKEEELKQLRLLAITGWTFFGLLSVFVIFVAVRDGRIICKDIHEIKDDTGEGPKQSQTRKEKEYEDLERDQQDPVAGDNYDDLQLENENTSEQVYENPGL